MINEKYYVRNIKDIASGKRIVVSVPGSKSITNRALLLAVLADGKSVLKGVLFSDDSRHFMECVKELGFETKIDEENKIIEVVGNKGIIPKESASIYVGSAGTAARFLTALLGMSKGKYYLDASQQMRKRPMAPLLKTLKELGADIKYGQNEGYFPFELSSDGITNDTITVNINTSSQFLSAMLISACTADKTLNINVSGKHGMAYIDMTINMMKQFGVDVCCKENCDEKNDADCGQKDIENRADDSVSREKDIVNNVGEDESISQIYVVKEGQGYKALDYKIEPDVSAACYFYALAAIHGATVLVKDVHFDCMQGDIQFVRYLEQMGCTVTDTPDGIELTGPADGCLKGITADMHACSDQAITMAAIAPYAQSPVKITGIGHIKYQESNRLMAIANELTNLGIKCERDEDSITINPGIPKSGTVSTYDDHRIAMGFAILGTKTDNVIIDNPGCCKKTFEEFFEVLDNIIDSL